MKVLIVCFSNLRGAPYIYPYIDVFQKNGTSYDVVYWNRHDIQETLDCGQLFAYNHPMADSVDKKIKFFRMCQYASYVKKIAKKGKYDRILVLTSLPGVLMSHFLTTTYKGRYIFDIRDHSYEQHGFYRKKIKFLMENSVQNVISSEGFRNFLPEADAILCHNCPKELTAQAHSEGVRAADGKVHISFIGGVRYAKAYLHVLRGIANHPRIFFDFYGFGTDIPLLQEFCKENDIRNVAFHGAYTPAEKPEIIEKSDVVFNVYGTDLHVKYAVSNKYYDALIYKKPLMVSRGTTMKAISEGFSYSVDSDFNAEDFLAWYDQIDFTEMGRICDEKLKKVQQDMERFGARIGEVVTSDSKN